MIPKIFTGLQNAGISTKPKTLGKIGRFFNLLCTAIDEDTRQGLATKYFAERIIELHLFPTFLDTKCYLFQRLWCFAKYLVFTGIKHLHIGLLRTNCRRKCGVNQDRLILQSEFSKDICVTPKDSRGRRSTSCYL